MADLTVTALGRTWRTPALAAGGRRTGLYADLALDGAALYGSTFVYLPAEDPPGELQLLTVPRGADRACSPHERRRAARAKSGIRQTGLSRCDC